MGKFKRNSQRRKERALRKAGDDPTTGPMFPPQEYLSDHTQAKGTIYHSHPYHHSSPVVSRGAARYKYHLGIFIVGLIIVLLLFSL